MQLNSLSLTNFRNYDDFALDFEPLTVLVGPNGVGKTNLLEAVYQIAVFSSYRARSSKDSIRWGQEFSRIVGQTNNTSVELFIDQKLNKSIKINGVEKKTIDALGQLVVVLFSPESLDIVSGAPQERRRFMNLLLGQTDKEYARSLISLNHILANRNRLLYRIKTNLAKTDELDFWDQELIKLNKIITEQRQILIDLINQNLTNYYQLISGSDDKLIAKYKKRADGKILDQLLIANRDQEINQTTTLYGPHRDELIFYLNDYLIGAGWSRGELRSAVLALKMSELGYLEKVHQGEITLLLDDVFSELDKERRSHLLELVSKHQTIITTTDKEHLGKDIIKKAKIVELGK
ncbi:MAG: DNA replication and repair protein recF [uncultured bacterium]|nr:MAG: DNA replication and repair protein recF [uncultured bacterium]